jgi:hypothetical protein
MLMAFSRLQLALRASSLEYTATTAARAFRLCWSVCPATRYSAACRVGPGISTKEGAEKLDWLGKLDAGSLKQKVAAAIVAISSIHLLKAFMNAPQIDNDKLMWSVIIHLTFVLSALGTAFSIA